ncbi:MAG: hypothetical protein ABIA04_08680 [Pseudomonadota bacterium]
MFIRKSNSISIILFCVLIYILIPFNTLYSKNFTTISDELQLKARTLGLDESRITRDLESIQYYEKRYEKVRNRLEKTNKWDFTKKAYFSIHRTTHKETLSKIIMEIDNSDEASFFENVDRAQSWFTGLTSNIEELSPEWITASNADELIDKYVETQEIQKEAIQAIEESKQKNLETAQRLKTRHKQEGRVLFASYYQGVQEYISGDYYASYKSLKKAKGYLNDGEENEFAEFLNEQIAGLETYFLEKTRESLNLVLSSLIKMDYIESNFASDGYDIEAINRKRALNEVAYDLNSDRDELKTLFGSVSDDETPIAIKRVIHAIDYSKKDPDAYRDMMKFFDKNHTDINLENVAWSTINKEKGVAGEAVLKAVKYRFGRLKEVDSSFSKLDRLAQRFSIGSLQAGLMILKEILNPLLIEAELRLDYEKRNEIYLDSHYKAKKNLIRQKSIFSSDEEFNAHVEAMAQDLYSNEIFSITAKDLKVPDNIKNTILLSKTNLQTAVHLAGLVKGLKIFQTVSKFTKDIAIEAVLFYCGAVVAKAGVSIVLKAHKAAKVAQLGTTVARQSLLRTTAIKGFGRTLLFTAFFTAFKAPVDGMIHEKSFLQMITSLPKEYLRYFEMFIIAGAIGFGFNNTVGKMMHTSSFFSNGSNLVIRETAVKTAGKWALQRQVVNELTRMSKFLKMNLEIGSQALGFTLYDELKEGILHGDTSFKGFWNELLMNFVSFYALHMGTATMRKMMEPPVSEARMYRESSEQRQDRMIEDSSLEAKTYYDRRDGKVYFTEEFRKLPDQEKLEIFDHEQKHAFFESLPLARQKSLLAVFKKSGQWEQIEAIVREMKPEIHKADELSVLSEALAIHEELKTKQSHYKTLTESEARLLESTTSILKSDRIAFWLDGQYEERGALSPAKEDSRSDKERLRKDTLSIKPTRKSTLGDGVLTLVPEAFIKSDLSTTHVKGELSKHMDKQTDKLQFNRELFADSQEVVDFAMRWLPETIQYDSHGRAEITLEVQLPVGIVIGKSKVVSLESIQRNFPDAVLVVEPLQAGGRRAEVEGVEGTWYPEMKLNERTGQWEVIRNDQGLPANPDFRFEPDAQVAYVDAHSFQKACETNKVTIIIEKNSATGKPEVEAIFPGNNAPNFPVIVDHGITKIDTVKADSPETLFWNDHVFVKNKDQARPNRLYSGNIFVRLIDRIAPRYRAITPKKIKGLKVGQYYDLDKDLKVTRKNPAYGLRQTETGLRIKCITQSAVIIQANGKKIFLAIGQEKALSQGDRVYRSESDIGSIKYFRVSFFEPPFEGATNPSILIKNLKPGESLYFTNDSNLNLIPLDKSKGYDHSASIMVKRSDSGEIFVLNLTQTPLAIITARGDLRTIKKGDPAFHLKDGDSIGLFQRNVDGQIYERRVKIADPSQSNKPAKNAAEAIEDSLGSFGIKVTAAFGEFVQGTNNGKIQSFAVSDIARPKKPGPNEDGLGIFKLRRKDAQSSDYYILSIDGMGGGGSGDRAMKIALDLIPKRILEESKNPEGFNNASITRVFKSVIEVYNNLSNKGEIGPSSGVCLTLVRIYEKTPGQFVAEIFWFGDSKTVIAQDGIKIYETKDHSLLNGFRDQGDEITPELERMWGHIVSRALKPNAAADSFGFHEINLLQGTRIIQASDGLWDFVKPEEAARIIKDARTPEEATNLLRDEALRRMDIDGHGDNLNIAVTFIN